jgi:hypothetical protein
MLLNRVLLRWVIGLFSKLLVVPVVALFLLIHVDIRHSFGYIVDTRELCSNS